MGASKYFVDTDKRRFIFRCVSPTPGQQGERPMSHPVKHTYKLGSPGAQRKALGITLTSIKKALRAASRSGDGAGELRRKFRKDGVLA